MHNNFTFYICVIWIHANVSQFTLRHICLSFNRGRAHQNQWNPKINQVHLCRHPDRGLLRLSWSQARRSFITTQLSVATQLQDRTPHYKCFLVIDKILCCIEHKEPTDRLQYFPPWKSRFEYIILLKESGNHLDNINSLQGQHVWWIWWRCTRMKLTGILTLCWLLSVDQMLRCYQP